MRRATSLRSRRVACLIAAAVTVTGCGSDAVSHDVSPEGGSVLDASGNGGTTHGGGGMAGSRTGGAAGVTGSGGAAGVGTGGAAGTGGGGGASGGGAAARDGGTDGRVPIFRDAAIDAPDRSPEASLDGAAEPDAAHDAGPPQDPLACIEERLRAAASQGSLELPVPPNCAGTPAVCCGSSTACDLTLDLTKHAGDTERLVISSPNFGVPRDDITLQVRVKTPMDIPITVPVVGNCSLSLDSAPGPSPDVQIMFSINRIATSSGPVAAVGDVTINGLTGDDIKISGSTACIIANLGVGSFVGTLRDTLADYIKGNLCGSCRCQ